MTRPRHWIKLWVAWLTTPAHFELSEGAFGLGPLLLLLCTWDGEYASGGWLLAEDGSPMSRPALQRATHRSSLARLDSQIAELVKCGTLKKREDGAFGFPKFGQWQETKAAKRMRTKREREREQFAHGDGQTEDDRRQTFSSLRSDQHASHAGQPSVAKRAARSKPKAIDDPHRDATTQVLRSLNETRASIAPDLTPLRKRDHIRARLADGATVEQLLAVIAFAADECRRKPEALRWLDAVTPFRPKNWESRLARAQAWQATTRTSPRLDVDHDALERRRREAEAFDREHRPWLFESASEEPV